MRRPIISTYRLQLRGPQADPAGRAFTFEDATSVVPYLSQLGVSHIYLSPILKAAVDSNHNYDVTDPTEINPELGGMEGFRKFAQFAREFNMGVIIDIVPNHLGVEDPRHNNWWWDVLKNGKDSEFESYFDIDWHADNGAGGKLGLPILGAENDEDKLTLTTDDVTGEVVLAYYDNFFPLTPGSYQSAEDDPLEVYAKQHYRLMYWRDGIISYRRFFSVNTLAGVRQEDPLVFEHTHRVLRQLCAEDLIDGVRVDHPDGLADPFTYLHRLRELVGSDRWLIIEKILGSSEPLDPRLDVDGTTGYDALRELDGVFIDQSAEDTMGMLALEHSGSTWNDTACHSAETELKRSVAADELGAEIARLSRAIRRDNFSTAGADVSDEELVETIVDLVAEIPVYRADYLSLSRVTATVVAGMATRFPSRQRALNLISAAVLESGEAKTRFSQVCGAVMAKGVEDTTFYRACRLVALQEVGGDPGRFGVSPAEFHLLQQERADLWPRAMTTLSTHDAKRSEDVRARVITLTEVPNTFSELVTKVSSQVPSPDSATGYFLFQNLLGIWPVDGEFSDTLRSRFHDYAIKAVREASLKSSWVEPDQVFEENILDWIDVLIDGPVSTSITEFIQEIDRGAKRLSLGRKMLHLTGPGIPDVYQGQEFYQDSLVDPDNRRFIDFTARTQTLSALDNENLPKLQQENALPGTLDFHDHIDQDSTGKFKQHITTQGLRLRRALPQFFVGGSYQAVFAQGRRAHHVVGLARADRESVGTESIGVIAVATRMPLTLDFRGGWKDTSLTLPSGQWVDLLTNRRFQDTVEVADIFEYFPTALLVHERLEKAVEFHPLNTSD